MIRKRDHHEGTKATKKNVFGDRHDSLQNASEAAYHKFEDRDALLFDSRALRVFEVENIFRVSGLPWMLCGVKAKRSLGDIQKKLEEQGHIYAITSLSPILVTLVRREDLRRVKEGKRWAYVHG